MAVLVLHSALFGASAALTITGTVTDETGEPLIGVSVKPDKSNTGVITDIDGKYTLSLPTPQKVTFSYVGMEPQTLDIKAAGTYDVVLKTNANALDDVVVVGFGTQRKVNLTGSVQSVTSQDIIRRSTSNGSTALQGIVPGLSAVQSSGAPGGDGATIKIRGLGSLNSDTAPLVLIDGVEGSMDRIDLNTVESISVLKDAASASIYGSRASNGVILITTKRGAQGKPKVTFNGYVGWNKPTELPTPLDAIGYMTAVDKAYANNDQEPIYGDAIDLYRTEGADQLNRYDTNWRDAILKKSAMVQNYSVGVSGGSEFLSIYASAGYYDQDGMIANNHFKRYSMRLNSDMQINRWIKLGVDLSIRQAEALNPIGGSTDIIGYAMTFTPTLSGINADGTWGYGLQGNNPIATVNAGGNSKSVAPQYIAKANLTLTPIEGLIIQGSYNFRRDTGRTKTFADQYDQYEGGVYKQTTPTDKAARENRSTADLIQFDALISYEKKIKQHYFKVMGAFQSEEYESTSLEAARKVYKYDGYEEIVNGDASTATNSSYKLNWAMLSYIFRVNYSFKDRYLLEVNGRYDGTSRFKGNQRWGFFPSVSAGWRITEESFMKDTSSWLNNLKLRASFGKLGNQSISSYFPYISAVSSAEGYGYMFDGAFTPGVAQTQLANMNIGWEKSRQYDVGLDWGFLNNRLTGGFDFYVRHIDDMLQKFPVPEFVSLEAPWQNAGSMRNTGWELSLEWNDRIGNVNYYVRGNLSDVRNKVLDLYGNEYKSGNTYTAEGLPYGNYYGYVADGFWQSYDEINAVDADGNYINPVYGTRSIIKPGFIKYKDLNGNGVVDGDDRDVIGNPTPRYEFGLTLGADWKGFDISVFFQGVGKKDVLYTGAGARALLGNGTIYEHQLDYWTEDNRDAKFPLLIVDNSGGHSNNLTSSFWVQSGAYCRLKNLVLGYTIPQRLTRKAFIERVRIYGSAQNLFTIRGNNFYKGFDPEGSGGAKCYPLNRTFLVGLQVEF